MDEVLKILNVEIGEEFELVDTTDKRHRIKNPYRFDEKYRLYDGNWHEYDYILNYLLRGELNIKGNMRENATIAEIKLLTHLRNKQNELKSIQLRTLGETIASTIPDVSKNDKEIIAELIIKLISRLGEGENSTSFLQSYKSYEHFFTTLGVFIDHKFNEDAYRQLIEEDIANCKRELGIK